MTIFDGFGHFRFRPKMYFHFRLFFVFGQNAVIFGRK